MRQFEPSAFTRRQFLWQGLTLASATAAVPAFLQSSALGLPMPVAGASAIPGVPEDHVLVVIQLSGGNDGLNTVVPFGEDAYYRARPGIAIRQEQALALQRQQGVGLHPALGGLKDLYDEGMLTIVQGVGYPNPNRSHFVSMDIWHTADTNATGEGWLGRYFDSQCCGYGKGESGTSDSTNPASQPGIAIGRTAPLAMEGRKTKPVAFETPDLFRWTGQDVHESLLAPYREVTMRTEAAGVAPESNASFLMRTALDAQINSDLIRKAVAQRPLVEYPRTQLGQQLAMIASMIRAGLKTRVYYASHGGFDTHAGQGGAQGSHARLLETYAQALRAFYRDLAAQENHGRVLTMTFSEFGRRVGQNASGGTDHGTAAPVFLAGPMVRAGLANEHPSMKNLDNGDLRYSTDFRTVYAAVLEHWLKADSKAILKGTYRPMRVIRNA
ncbi:MAG: DUF1501 domain-containing protein [Phycisphaeraceae bacterium]|nr:DUF1501 domain-containing protein [Phycisphaeraceae bacterium]